MTTRKQVLVFRDLPPDQLACLQAVHEVTVANPRLPAQRDAFFAALPAAQRNARLCRHMPADAPLPSACDPAQAGASGSADGSRPGN